MTPQQARDQLYRESAASVLRYVHRARRRSGLILLRLTVGAVLAVSGAILAAIGVLEPSQPALGLGLALAGAGAVLQAPWERIGR